MSDIFKWQDYKITGLIPSAKSGRWRIERFTVPKKSIENVRMQIHGETPVPPGVYTRLIHVATFADTIMSDTPSEIIDLSMLFHRACGRVLLNGLGLGVALRGVLMNLNVREVHVVEKSEDVLNMVEPIFTDYRAYKLARWVHRQRKHLVIHHADALEFQFQKGFRFDAVWHDIWPNVCSDNLESMRALKRKYARRTAWQGCWREISCMRLP
jgi:hypothetical protein